MGDFISAQKESQSMSFETQLKQNYSAVHSRLLNPAIKPNPVPVLPKTPDKTHPQQRKFFQLSTTILPRTPKLHQLLRLASAIEGIEINVIMGPRKQRSIVIARQLYYFFAYYYTRASLHQIGQVVGGKDHTTVLHGVRKMEILFNDSPLWQEKFSTYLACIKELCVQLGPVVHS